MEEAIDEAVADPKVLSSSTSTVYVKAADPIVAAVQLAVKPLALALLPEPTVGANGRVVNVPSAEYPVPTELVA